MEKLFGTDGIRGLANTELTCDLALKVGKATAAALMLENKSCKHIIVGMDTRLSSTMLETGVASGLCSMGVDVTLLGVVPTPAVAYLVKKYGADAGIMISASHNPWMYNGIKVFGNNGMKISDNIEILIEELVLLNKEIKSTNAPERVGKCTRSDLGKEDYCDYINSTCDINLSGIKVLIDCANGSASTTASDIFAPLGLDLTIINDDPDGTNINADCGSTCIENLSPLVIEGKYDLAVAFDGDADRVLAVDGTGELFDGDKILAVLAKHFSENGMLNKSTVVGTVMSNLGLGKFCDQNGINMIQTGVGDRYVVEAMERDNLNLGGEQSGHTIIRNYQTTGDGQLTALQILKIMKLTGKSLSELGEIMTYYPQVLKNIKADKDQKKVIFEDEEVINIMQIWENKLKESGRILVRASGTEPLIRVMVEAKDQSEALECADDISRVIKGRLSGR